MDLWRCRPLKFDEVQRPWRVRIMQLTERVNLMTNAINEDHSFVLCKGRGKGRRGRKKSSTFEFFTDVSESVEHIQQRSSKRTRQLEKKRSSQLKREGNHRRERREEGNGDAPFFAPQYEGARTSESGAKLKQQPHNNPSRKI